MSEKHTTTQPEPADVPAEQPDAAPEGQPQTDQPQPGTEPQPA